MGLPFISLEEWFSGAAFADKHDLDLDDGAAYVAHLHGAVGEEGGDGDHGGFGEHVFFEVGPHIQDDLGTEFFRVVGVAAVPGQEFLEVVSVAGVVRDKRLRHELVPHGHVEAELVMAHEKAVEDLVAVRLGVDLDVGGIGDILIVFTHSFSSRLVNSQLPVFYPGSAAS